MKKNIKNIFNKGLFGNPLTTEEMHIMELQQVHLEMQVEYSLSDLLDEIETLVQTVSKDVYPDELVLIVNRINRMTYKSWKLYCDLSTCHYISEHVGVEGERDE
jgi:hypothetical protein